nr:MAG TPA: hypothetical protein [Caudoviricetes sp.]
MIRFFKLFTIFIMLVPLVPKTTVFYNVSP